jgi:hypothetical protein
VKQVWEPEELVAYWTLVDDDWRLLGNKTGATRLGFALVLKYIEIEGEFPRFGEQVPLAAVEFVAGLVKVDPAEFAKYSFDNRTAEYHRAQIRQALGLRPATDEDKARWTEWLAAEQCPVEQDRDRLQAAVRQRCRSEGIEPPVKAQVERVVNSAVRRHEIAFAAHIVGQLEPAARTALQALLESEGALAEVKADPGPLGLDTLMSEIAKLTTVRALRLPEDLFADVSDRLVVAWRSRAARMFPSDFAACDEPIRYTLLAALCWVWQAEITDALVGLLIDLVHRINARAERRVEKELLGRSGVGAGQGGHLLEDVHRGAGPARRRGPRCGVVGGALPAGDGRDRPAGQLRLGGRQGEGIRSRGDGAHRRRGAQGVAGRGHRRPWPGRTHPL